MWARLLVCALKERSLPHVEQSHASLPRRERMLRAVFTHLGYPTYLLPFIGIAKILAAITVLVPGLPRLKEWAYAGLVFDLIGAFYSHLSVGDPPGNWLFPIIGLLLVAGSYVFYRKKMNYQGSDLGAGLPV